MLVASPDKLGQNLENIDRTRRAKIMGVYRTAYYRRFQGSWRRSDE